MIADWLEKHQLTCSVKSHLGIECPGCGTQRSLIALFRGDIIASIQYHPGVILFLITLIIVGLQIKFNFRNGGTVAMWAFISTVTVTMVNYALKMAHVY
ncbi:MAG: hypothetical protein K0S33_2492 [Bacteroidetes bacterium]|jgi:hypothetical protein|nr:hypothetical protein [Bacteroidota bacterium]